MENLNKGRREKAKKGKENERGVGERQTKMVFGRKPAHGSSFFPDEKRESLLWEGKRPREHGGLIHAL